jgi:hypothetical protein
VVPVVAAVKARLVVPRFLVRVALAVRALRMMLAAVVVLLLLARKLVALGRISLG